MFKKINKNKLEPKDITHCNNCKKDTEHGIILEEQPNKKVILYLVCSICSTISKKRNLIARNDYTNAKN